MMLLFLVCGMVVERTSGQISDDGVSTDCKKRIGECCNSCTEYDPDVLNVHIVAHSHNDVGGIKTVDQYYYGTNKFVQNAGVQYILGSVVEELWSDPKRMFVYVETAFFWKWWVHQPDSVRDRVQTLVRQGRLQFAGGAWSSNDEATTHYQSIIDQFTWGLNKLNETFGMCGRPNIAWQIGQFGHSREFASLLTAMGYDGLFLGRIDHQDKEQRLLKKRMEMVWRGDDSVGKSSDMFTSILYNGYYPPNGFCFDNFCYHEPIVDDPNSPLFNVDKRVSLFLDYARNQSRHYVTNNVLLTMGGDFAYQEAGIWYRNLDRLIEYCNLKAVQDGLNIKIFYSTPKCYYQSVQRANPSLPIKQDDFFPYGDVNHIYSTGYFTSRPTLKYFERDSNRYLQMVKQLQIWAGLEHLQYIANELKSAMGIMQHHDAITGTEKEHVAHDYERLLNIAVNDAMIIVQQAINKYMQNNASDLPTLNFRRCPFNESRCPVSELSEQFILSVYNPLAWHVTEVIRIPVAKGDYEFEIFSPDGGKVTAQLIDIPEAVTRIPTRISIATHELYFIVQLEPVCYKTFYIRKSYRQRRSTLDNDQQRRRRSLSNNQHSLRRSTSTKDQLRRRRSVYNNHHRKMNSFMDLKLTKPNFGKTSKYFRKFFPSKNEIEKPQVVKYFPLKHKTMKAEIDQEDDVDNEKYIFKNKFMKLHLNTRSDSTDVILNDGSKIRLKVQFNYYANTLPSRRVLSDAYRFDPDVSEAMPLNMNASTIGPIVNEIRLTANEYLHTIIRLYKDLNFIETEWLVGPINNSDGISKEIIVQYSTNLENNSEFFTDANGRQVLKRILNKRPTWDLKVHEPISSNYYPVTNKIYINGDRHRFSVITDRAQGGSSLKNGQIELMLHRRLLQSGKAEWLEPLNEIVKGKGLVVRGKHRLLFTNNRNKQDSITEKKQVLQFHLQPIVLICDAGQVSLERWLELPNKNVSWTNSLPEGLHLLTVEPFGDDSLLLRIENYLDTGDNAKHAIDVDIQQLFKTIRVKSYKETKLAGNIWKDDYKKHYWKREKRFAMKFNDDYGRHHGMKKLNDNDEIIFDKGFVIRVKPKQIKTFIVKYEHV